MMLRLCVILVAVYGSLLILPIAGHAAQREAKAKKSTAGKADSNDSKSGDVKSGVGKNNSGSDRRPKGKRNAQAAAEAIPGYTVQQIQGFNVIINNEVLGQDTSKFERKPLEVLELELSTIVNLMPPDATAALRRLLIWVEWNEQLEMANGRKGGAEAVYYGGHQLQLLKEGKHPLKAKSVTVLSMLALTGEHQPNHESGRCVLLHEMAHAVHSELLGRESQPVKAAYYQAMQRNLYEKHLYAATNEQEFFAETTCAYFDQLHYYPKTRTDLEKHDPVTFQLMQQVWGKRPTAKATFAKNASGKPGSKTGKESDAKGGGIESAKPVVKLADLDLGKPLSGPTFTKEDFKGRAVMLVLWNSNSSSSLSCLSKVETWDDELRNFGLVTIGEHLTAAEQTTAEKTVDARNVSFAVTEARWTNRSLVKNFTDFPLCVVFDHDGQSVYQGSPFDAEEALRRAVGGALVASLGTEELPKPLAAIAKSLNEGMPPQTQLMKLASLARSKKGAGNELAAKLLDRVSENGRNQVEEARKVMEKDPVTAFIKLERVATAYKGAPVAQEATQIIGKLRTMKIVQLEIKARQGLVVVKQLDTELSSRAGSFDPLQNKFRTQNAGLLGELHKAVTQMVESWPEAKATSEAKAIGFKYGVTL